MNWKGQVLHLLVHWAFPLIAGLATLLVWKSEAPALAVRRFGWRALAAAALVAKAAYFGVLYLALGHRPSFDYRHFVDLARNAGAGELAGRDFPNFYGPLFPYLLAAGDIVMPGGEGPGVIVVFLLADALLAAAAYLLARGLLGEQEGARVGLVVAVTPLLWHLAIVWAQDEALFLAFLAVALLLMSRDRHAAAGAVLGLGLCCTKALFAPYAIGALAPALVGPRRYAAAAWFTVVAGAVHIAYWAAGADPLSFLGYRGDKLPLFYYNLYDLALLLGGPAARIPGLTLWAAAVAVTAVACALGSRGMPQAWRPVYGVAAVHAVSMLLQPFCLEVYLAQGFLPLLLILRAGSPWTPRSVALALACLLALFASVLTKVPGPVTLGVVVPAFLALHLLVLGKIARDILCVRRGEWDKARPEAAVADGR